MIKLEHVVLASPEQMKFIIEDKMGRFVWNVNIKTTTV